MCFGITTCVVEVTWCSGSLNMQEEYLCVLILLNCLVEILDYFWKNDTVEVPRCRKQYLMS